MENWPTVTVVIPARNEAGSIAATLASVVGQDYPLPLDVVVVDGASSDNTPEIVGTFAHHGVRLVYNRSGLTAAGLNAGIAASDGEVVVRCDGHAQLPDGYIRRAVEVLMETGADNVGGVQDAHGTTPVQRAVAAAMSSRVGVGDADFHIGGEPGPADTVYLGVFRRSALERVGGFDETQIRSQDSELNVRIRQTGGSVWFDPSLRVRYQPRASFRALANQYWQYGRWKRRVIRQHPSSVRWRQLAPPVFVLGLVACVIIAALGNDWAWIPPVIYLVVVVGVGVATALRRRDLALLMMPAALAIMHVAWGAGFLVGPPGDA